jgi:hypothetical protein
VIRFIDSKGHTLVQEKLAVSGSPTVEGKRTIDLSVETTDGNKPLAPVLMRQSNPKQRVTFDGDRPSRFTQKRYKEIGCTTRSRETPHADALHRQCKEAQQCT